MRSIHELLSKLNRVREVKPGQYIAIWSGHHDTEPSLSIKEADDNILLKCFAGCTTEAIVQAMGLTLADLFLNDRKPQWKSKEIVSFYPYHNADGYENGRRDAESLWKVTFCCHGCSDLIDVATEELREAAAEYMQEHQWGHLECIEELNRRESGEQP